MVRQGPDRKGIAESINQKLIASCETVGLTRSFLCIIIVLIGCLSGCDSPSPQFIGAQKTEVAQGGMRFSIHRRGNLVEAYRLGFIFRPSETAVLSNARQAIERATGCLVAGLSGDQALIKARLNCDSAPQTPVESSA